MQRRLGSRVGLTCGSRDPNVRAIAVRFAAQRLVLSDADHTFDEKLQRMKFIRAGKSVLQFNPWSSNR